MFACGVGGLLDEDAEEVGDDQRGHSAENRESDDGDSWIGEIEESEEDGVVDEIHAVRDSPEILRNGGVEAEFEARVLDDDDNGGRSEHGEEVAGRNARAGEHGVAVKAER